MAKRRSAKQRRNDRRLANFGRRKTNKRSSVRKVTVRRRSYRKRAGGFIRRRGGFRKIGGGIVSYARPMAAGVGGAMIASAISDRVAPQYSQIAGYGGAYLAGGIKGVAGKVLFDVVSGNQLGILGGGGSGGGGSL